METTGTMREKNPPNDPKSKQAFFNNLPSELMIDILSRLPVRTIISCKCVHKSWLHLIETEEVVKSRLSNSVPGLLTSKKNEDGSISYRFYEFEEETARNTDDDNNDIEVHKLHYNPATPWFNIPCPPWFNIPCRRKIMIDSANGLVFWHDGIEAKNLFICNPTTREYISLPCAEDFQRSSDPFVRYGFGVTKISGQHKVVKACGMGMRDDGYKFDYHVYTLGTGSWRRIHPSIHHNDHLHESFVFVNGKLHWLSIISSPCIFSLDLETELFGTPISPLPVTLNSKGYFSLFATLDSLCLCELTYAYKEITVWLVKEDNVWEKEFVFRYNPPGYFYGSLSWLRVKVVKIFKDGDILLEWFNMPHATCLNKMGKWDWLECWDHVIIHTPSFLSLKSFQMENVISF